MNYTFPDIIISHLPENFVRGKSAFFNGLRGFEKKIEKKLKKGVDTYRAVCYDGNIPRGKAVTQWGGHLRK